MTQKSPPELSREAGTVTPRPLSPSELESFRAAYERESNRASPSEIINIGPMPPKSDLDWVEFEARLARRIVETFRVPPAYLTGRPRYPGRRMEPPTSGGLRGLNPSFVIADECHGFDHWPLAPLTWRDVPLSVYGTAAAFIALALAWGVAC